MQVTAAGMLEIGLAIGPALPLHIMDGIEQRQVLHVTMAGQDRRVVGASGGGQRHAPVGGGDGFARVDFYQFIG